MPRDDESPTPGEIKARELIARLLGAEPRRVWATSSPDAKFAQLLDGRQVVIKWPGWRNDNGSVLAESWVYREGRQRGLRVPSVVAVSEDPECMIIERIPGPSIADQAPGAAADLWAAAGEDLRRLHEIGLPGFGPLQLVDGAARGGSAAWCPFADEARHRSVPRLVDRGFLDHDVGARLIRRLAEAEPLFAAVTGGRLLHGDLTSGHVFGESGTYRGMIDFGQAQVGDARWDFARVTLWDGPEALTALLDGYGRDAVTPEDWERLLPLYLLAYVCHHAADHPNADHIRMVLDRTGYRALL